MTTTTSYGTWSNHAGNLTVESSVYDALGSYSSDYDVDAIVAGYRAAINHALPDSVSLHGDEFYGPFHATDQNFDGYPATEDGDLDIKTIVDSIDFWAIAARHENQAATALEDLEMPAHIHLAVLRGRDVVTGEELAYPVLWADRTYDRCPSCGQSIPFEVTECPIALDEGAGQGGALQEYSQQHGCGEWLPVLSVRFEDGESDKAKVAQAAAELAKARTEEIAAARTVAEERVEQELERATAQLLAPLGDDETVEDRLEAVCTGNEIQPGVYIDRGHLTAWDFPAINDDSDPIVAVSTFPHVFMVQVQASADGRDWQGLHPAETVISDNVRRLALDIAANQTLADVDGGRWRIAVWDGATTGDLHLPERYILTDTEVSVELGKERLAEIGKQIRALEQDRNTLMALLKAAGVSQRELARITGVSHPTAGKRAESAEVSVGSCCTSRKSMPASRSTSRAAFRPFAPVTPPPGWVPEPHW